MSRLLSILRAEHSTEHELKKYSKPKIYHGGKNFDLSKRWYIYYSYRNPVTGEMVRQPNVYNNINQDFKTVSDRLKHIKIMAKHLENMLKNGFSPYDMDEIEKESSKYTSFAAIDFGLSMKKETVNEKTFGDYENKIGVFKRFLKNKNLDYVDIKSIKKAHVIEFLNGILIKTTPSTRNSYRSAISAVFTVLYDNEYIDSNFVRKINILKAKPERNKTYELDEVDKIYTFIEKNEPHLLLLIKFVCYNFLRPVEACRLQVKDLKLNSQPPVLHVRAKNKPVKIKIIPQIMIDELEKLDLSNEEDYLFTNKGIGPTELTADRRREYFTKKYKYKVKNKLGLGDDFTLYSFRHTFITKLYREFIKTMTQTETFEKLRLITGHETVEALLKYLRDIDAILPEDYTKYLK